MKRKLLSMTVALLCTVGGWAYSTSDLTTAGWTQVSSLDDITSNVYVFVDANSSNYAVEGSSTTGRAMFKTLENPFEDLSEVWTIETRSGGYAIRNAGSQFYFNSGPNGWDSFNAATYESGTFTFTFNNAKYDLKSVTTNKYVGPWDSQTEVTPSNLGVAANKDNSMGFYIYKMAKATYALKYMQNYPNLAAPVDLSFLVVNPTIYQSTNKGTIPSGWTKFAHITGNGNYTEADGGDTQLEAWHWTSDLNADYYQTITNLPAGKYAVTAYVHSREAAVGNVYIYNETNGKARSDSPEEGDDKYADRTTSYLAIPDNGSGNIGIEVSGTATWFTGDNFRLAVDPYLSTIATALPANGAMEAGRWYSFTPSVTDNYDMSGTATISNIIYATGDTKTLSDAVAENNTFSDTQSLTAGTTFYVRSSSDNTLSYVPHLNAIAADLPNSAVTADTWYKFTTGNSSDAYTLSSTDAATVTYSTDGTLYSNDASITDTWVLTATMNVLLAPSTTYYIKSNAAVTLTKNESLVTSSYVNGWAKVTTIEQLATNPEDYFFAIFSANNTGLILDANTTSNDEKLRYKTAVNPLSGSAYLFEMENYNSKFVLKSVINGKYFENRSTSDTRFGQDGPWNYHADLDEKSANCEIDVTFANGVCTIQDKNADGSNNYIGLWTPNNGYNNNQNLAGNKSGNEKGSFIIYRIAKDGLDVSSLITNPSFESDGSITASDAALTMTGWTQSVHDAYSNTGCYDASANIPTQGTVSVTPSDGSYSLYFRLGWHTGTTCTFTSNASTLPAGMYNLSVDYKMVEGYDNTHNNNTSITISAKKGDTVISSGQGTTKADIVGSDDYTYLNSADWSTVTSSFELTEPTSVNIVLSLYVGGIRRSDFCLDNVRLTYSAFATTADYTALASAISSAESHTLGFDEGEYTPYTHAEALQALASAKAIDSNENNSQLLVRTLTSTLVDATWTANVAEVNAIYDGLFKIQEEHTTSPTALVGWTEENGIRQLIKNTTTNPGLSSLDSESGAVFSWGGTVMTYGEKTGYTLPLNAQTIYELSLKATGWRDSNLPTAYYASVLRSANGMASTNILSSSITTRVNQENPFVELKP